MDQQPEIIAYLKPHCGWSRGVRAVLQKYNLSFVDKDIIGVPENYDEMVRVSGQTLQPTLKIGDQVVADVSGEELEAWLVREKIVSHKADAVEVSLNSACSDEEHAAHATGWTPPISVK